MSSEALLDQGIRSVIFQGLPIVYMVTAVNPSVMESY